MLCSAQLRCGAQPGATTVYFEKTRRRWKMTMGKINAFSPPFSAAPDTPTATFCTTPCAASFTITCSSFTCGCDGDDGGGGAGARGEVLFGTSRCGRGREARRGLQSGDMRSFLRRAAAGEGAEAHDLQPGEVLVACRRGRRRWGARSAFRCRGDMFLARVGVGEDAEACSSINSGRRGALLGSSVAFGSGCGKALPGVPRKALPCFFWVSPR